MGKVVLEKIEKLFPKTGNSHVKILDSIDLCVEKGEFLVLVGPSGCGKSTLLRLVAGLDMPTRGKIYIGERLVNDLAPKERQVSMVFQNYALYPHLNVYDNIAFGLRRLSNSVSWWRMNKTQRQHIDLKVRSVASMLQIEPLLKRRPAQLSGGQKQRVALARAIAHSPQVFLLDEPLSNLDAQLRAETRSQIVNLQKKLAVTTIYVTHDQVEAMTMGNRIAVLNHGVLQQIDTPSNIYNHPANRFVAEFIGSPMMNFLTIDLEGELSRSLKIKLPEAAQSKVTLGIRPEHLRIDPLTGDFKAQIEGIELLGADAYLFVRLLGENDVIWQVRVSPSNTYKNGDLIWLNIEPERIHLFDLRSGQAFNLE
ncbi:MAG: ABC transporter ATP-binding protein [Cyanobacteriota bacterium ELA615]